MSAHGQATPGDAAASDEHHFEGIPADWPGPDEPRTPLWLPLVGLGLLLFALLAYVMTRPSGKTGAELAAEAAPEASAAAVPSALASVNPRIRRLPQGLMSAFAPGAPGAMGAPPGAVPRPPGAMGAPPGAVPRPTGAAGVPRPRPLPAPPPGQ